jgi:hypothetical protein
LPTEPGSVAARRNTHREAEPEALAHRRGRRDIASRRQRPFRKGSHWTDIVLRLALKRHGVGWRNQDKMGAVDSSFGSVFMLYRVAIVAGLFAFAVISSR